jgi:hypothetical protein
MGKLRGITIQLLDKQKTGTDGFGKAIYEDVAIDIDNVLIGEPSTEDITDTYNLTGKHLAYTLAIPKEDTHTWTNRRVSFFGGTFRTIGEPTQGIEAMIPLAWNKKVKVERYE